ncbi:Dam family site-specific DNA-(adenine-N6)-methyltransferase [Methanosphaera sp. WGK6]|uniref:DNA adenine methylase n=1 Tax=Methanosphaera sp. WGK6 TaxID=1561964 RepID=UPI00084CA1C8|nr:Dam family site-specific DNA-(adenine-N6)-methyltransferase [Methanosphaera sp. WGK6]
MNKTCFNGLFRLNRKGEFNVPYGKYKNPTICDEENITNVHEILKDVTIENKTYTYSEKFIDENSFVYLDPPYRPLSKTSNFTSYSENNFNDDNQKELAQYFSNITRKGAWAMLSNSDPHNTNPDDNFFDDLYSKYTIKRVKAKRSINSKGNSRGEINEILVTNY